MKYQRILLKLSGEAFGNKNNGLDFSAVKKVASNIESVRKNTKVELVVVVGAGNLFRARNVEGTEVDHVVADNIGMLGTVMNALALQECMERLGNNTRVMSAIPINNFCEPYIRRRALRHLEKGRTVILGGGTGNPLCTTDFAAALRAIELKCQVLLKASNIDAIYDKDPKKFKDAKILANLSYQFALEKDLRVMDSTAFALCREEEMPIIIFNFNRPENIEQIIRGKHIGTLVSTNILVKKVCQ